MLLFTHLNIEGILLGHIVIAGHLSANNLFETRASGRFNTPDSAHHVTGTPRALDIKAVASVHY
jgi:hypothetical protein